LLGRPPRLGQRLPLGTHLCLGGWLVWLYGPLQLGSRARPLECGRPPPALAEPSVSSSVALLSDPSAIEKALGDCLKSDGRLDERGLERAVKAGATGREGLLAVLSKLGLVGDRDLAASVAAVLGLPLAGTADYPDAALASERLGSRFLREVRALPLREEGAALAVAVADPLDGYALEAVRFATGRPVVPWVAVPAELDQAIERLYGRPDAASASDRPRPARPTRTSPTSSSCATWRARRR
jgi:hypothetical protein